MFFFVWFLAGYILFVFEKYFFFNDSSSHALVDELRKRTSEEDILDFEEKFNL